jgi:hypothetical protein
VGRSFLLLLRITGILYVVRGILSPVGGGGGDLFVAREPKYGDKKGIKPFLIHQKVILPSQCCDMINS